MNYIKIDPHFLWNQDIVHDKALKDLFDKTIPARYSSSIMKKIDTPPIFIYLESRDEQNSVNTRSLYSNPGSEGTIEQYEHGRTLLEIRSEYGIRPFERGQILDAFCRIEFVIDVLICIEMGVYREERGYADVAQRFKESTGTEDDISTFYLRVRYLRKRKILSRLTFDLLMKIKAVRDVLSHQYMPEVNIGLEQTALNYYGKNYITTLNTMFDGAWFYLLKDYNEQQMELILWFNKAVLDGQK